MLISADWQTSLSTLSKCEASLQRLIFVGEKYSIGSVLLLGDQKHAFNPVDMRVIDFTLQVVKEITRRWRLYMLLGNHDLYHNRDGAKSFLHLLAMAGARVIERVERIPIGPWEVGFLPYRYSISTAKKEAKSLQRSFQGPVDRRIVAFHGAVCGFDGGPRYVVSDDDGVPPSYFSECRYAIGGHLHKPQSNRNVYYVGSPYCTDWGEANQRKRFLVLKDNGKLLSIPTNIPGLYNADMPGFHENKPEQWAGSVVRIRCEAGKVVSARKAAALKFKGADIEVIPVADDPDTVSEKVAVSEREAIRNYVHANCPANIAGFEEEIIDKILFRTEKISKTLRFGQKLYVDSITAENVLSFKKVQVRYPQGKVILVRGVNHDRGGRSNGAGKTSFLSLPCIAVLGESTKGQRHNSWVRRKCHKTSKITMNLRIGRKGLVVKITRTRRPGRLVLKVGGKDISTGGSPARVQRDIETLTGLDKQLLKSAVYVDQTEVSKFLYGTDKDRYQIVERFFGLERFDLALEEEKENQKGIRRLLEDNAISWEKTSAVIKENQGILSDVERQVDLKRERKSYKRTMADFDAAERLTPKLKALLVERHNTEHKLTLADGDLKASQKKLWQAESRVSLLKQELADNEDLVGKNCPTCGQRVVGVSIKKSFSGKNLKEAQRWLKLCQKTFVAADKFKRRYRRAFDLQQNKIAEIEYKQRDAREKKERAQDRWSQVKKHEKLVAGIQSKLSGLVLRLNTIRKARKELRRYLKISEFVVKALHRDGVPMQLCKSLYPSIDAAAVKYSNLFTDNALSVRFVSDEGGIRPVVINPSGGEGLRDQSYGESKFASLIVAFALREAIGRINLMVLDDPTGGLDTMGVREFAKALKVAAPAFGCVLVTTHNSDLESCIEADDTWIVEKRNGISRMTSV